MLPDMGRRIYSVAPVVLIAGSGLVSTLGGLVGGLVGGLGGLAPPVTSPAPTAPAKGCPNASVPAAQLSLPQFDGSVFCLINKRRAANGRTTLRPNGALQRAAYDYAGSMEVGRFFSHYGDFAGHSTGSNPIQRLRQMGYIRPHYVWIVGEDLHWTTAEESAPADTVQAWMDSAIHRQYLLSRKFEQLGVGTMRGVPYNPNQLDGVTVAAEFGFRRR
jgi:uncharacterized protein YkwD